MTLHGLTKQGKRTAVSLGSALRGYPGPGASCRMRLVSNQAGELPADTLDDKCLNRPPPEKTQSLKATQAIPEKGTLTLRLCSSA